MSQQEQSAHPQLPAHVGIIMDGNRRWARARALPTLEGHRRGLETFRDITKAALARQIPYLTAYVFSTENWSRTQEEVSYLMGLVIKAVESYLDEFHELGVRVTIIGSRDGLDKKVLAAVDRTEEKTKNNTAMTVGLCFNYGGHQEIVDAVRGLVASGVPAGEITKQLIASRLYCPEVPPCDLIIRTSGEQRLSGFMLWRSEYAEFRFIDKHWPDFTETDLDEALTDYASRKRRLGK